MNVKEEIASFENMHSMQGEATKLTFKGVDGYDVYNCSQPFLWADKAYIFGRIEHRNEWMRSWIRLFIKTGQDEWTLVPDSTLYQLEDPYISIIHDQLVFGGTHVRLKQSELDTYYGYFYRGNEIDNLYYFTTGPDYMKDIRLVELSSGKIGVFSRPRSQEILEQHGSESMIGFTIIDHLEDLNDEIIEHAPLIEGLFSDGEWGGCNQAYLLDSGKIGVLGHVSYQDEESAQSVYANMTFVFDPETRDVTDYKIVATRASYPAGPAKKSHLQQCAFTSGLVPLGNGKAELYSGIGDCEEGKVIIDYPFANSGKIVEKKYHIY